MKVRNRLREIRHKMIIDKQIEMAKLLGLTQQQYNGYEHKQIEPTLKTALQISRKLNRPVDWIFYLD